ncbi:hypothetical protein ACOME3_008283 [Neoechinorhynchus agilis]
MDLRTDFDYSIDDTLDSSELGNSENQVVGHICSKENPAWEYISSKLHDLKVNTVQTIGEDWIFLSLLGLSMSIISFAVDVAVEMLRNCIIKSYMSSSGIPEIRAILRGVQLSPKILTINTAVVKVVALTAALGSGVPIGKTGPFVHICSAVAIMIGNWLSDGTRDLSSMTLIYNDMLVVACATGVAATFNAPIGGVLFSIEVTSTHFNIKNYWRGFYASLLGALFFRSISLARDKASTLLPLEFLKFHTEFPFAPVEIIFFAILGVYSGIFGSIFTVLYKYLTILENKLRMKMNVKVWKVFYTFIISVLIFSTTFPHSIGHFMGKDQTMNQKLKHLLSFGFWNGDMAKQWTQIQETWSHNNTFGYLAIFFTVNFILSVLASTLPIPLGLFAPLFILGGTFGRLFGELLAMVFPDALVEISRFKPIIPAGYALAGAAGFSGSASHTLSIAVIAVEVTGEILYLLPIMVAVATGNIVAKRLHLSIYDTINKLKKLPLMPEITSDNYRYFDIKLINFMNREFNVVEVDASASSLTLLVNGSDQVYYPVVRDGDILVGVTTKNDIYEYIKNEIDKHGNREKGSMDVSSSCLASDFNQLKVTDSVHQLPASASLNEVHTIFQLLALKVAFVSVNGKLIGIVTEKEIENTVATCSDRWAEMKNLRHTSDTLRPSIQKNQHIDENV